ncbi:alpha/beta fold hydrolase [Oleiphilus messinensis]|nr:alpha/beta hydrolase [Oleiphilus messinensis]
MLCDLVEYQVLGTGLPSVIFINGFRMPYSSWDQVYPEIADTCQVLLYNRPSVGTSAETLQNQHGMQIIEDLHALCGELALPMPCVLVAHSLGGIFAQLFARHYPDAVAGAVFVDAAHPDEIAQHRKHRAPVLLHALNQGLKSLEKWFDPFKYSEDESLDLTLQQLEAAGSFPDIPIRVITGTQKLPLVPMASFALHCRYQHELVSLSTRSKQIQCTQSAHFPQLSESDKVTQAILDIIALSKGDATGT